MIRVLSRALDVLEYLAERPADSHGLAAIAIATRLDPATARRILSALAARSYVEQPVARQGYRLGSMSFALTARGPYAPDLVAAANPPVAVLAAHLGETVLLAVLRDGRRFTLCQADGSRAIQVRTTVLLDPNPYRRATGRLLLAHLDPAALAAFIRAAGLPGAEWPEARSRSALDSVLARIRREPVYVLFHDGLAAVAAPVRAGACVVASLGAYMPVEHFRGRRTQVLKALCETATAISRAVPPVAASSKTQP